MADTPAETLVWVRNPEGKVVRIDSADLQKAANEGYKTATQAEADQAERHQQLSGGVGGAIAAGAGLASAASLGASDIIAHQLGLGADVRAASEEHPIAHGVGELAGYAAPVVGQLGATAALGNVAKSVAEKALISGGEGIIKKAALKAAVGAAESIPYTAQQLVSESALGDPSVTAEHLLSTVGMNALGFGAFTGGASVAKDLAKPAFEALSSGSKRLRDTFDKYYSQLSPEHAEAMAERNQVKGPLQGPQAPVPGSGPDRNAVVAELTDAIKETNAGLKEAQREFAPIRAQTRETLLKDVPLETAQAEAGRVIQDVGQRIEQLRGPQDIFSKSVIDGAASKLDSVASRVAEAKTSHQIYEELDTLRGHLADLSKAGKGVAAAPSVADAQKALKGVFQDVRNGLENSSVWGEAAAAQAEHNSAYSAVRQAKDNLLAAMGEGKGFDRDISATKVSSWLNKAEGVEGRRRWELFNDYVQGVQNYNDMAQKWSDKLGGGEHSFDASALESLLERNQKAAEQFKGYGEVQRGYKAAEQAGKADEAFRAAQAAEAAKGSAPGSSLLGLGAVHALVTGHTGIGAAIIGAKGLMKVAHTLLTEPQKVAATLSKLEALGQGILRREDAIVKAVGRGAEMTGRALARTGGVIKEAHDEESFRKQVDSIKQMAGSPEAMIERSGQLFGGLTNAAPATTAAAGLAMANKVQYLASKAPATQMATPMGHVNVKVPPSQAIRYGARVQIANDPVAILGHVANGTLNKEHMETMAALYPGMLQRQRGKLLDRLSTMSTSELAAMKPNQRASVSLFLGMPVTNAFTPKGINGYQQVYMKIAQAPVAPKMPSARVMQSPQAFMTRQQRIATGHH